MAWDDWSDAFLDVYEATPGIADLEDWETGHVEALYEAGFTHSAEEYEAMGLSEDDVAAIREEFFDYLGIDESDFDWEGWREAMGYELALSGERVSWEAIQRDRVASRERYWHNRPSRQKAEAAYRAAKFEAREFIGWDSEGYDYFIVAPNGEIEVGSQRTMLFGCYGNGSFRYVSGIELTTKQMLDLVLEVEADNPDAFHVGFGFEYDINQMLRDLPWRMLAVLKITGKVRWNGYRIAHIPHKLITITKDGRSATIYDTSGFFHCKYLTALSKYGIGTDEELRRIDAGKSRRGKFTYADLPEVIDYMRQELVLFSPLMDKVRESAYGGGFRISAWHGPGALAAYAIKYNNVRSYMSHGKIPGFVREVIRAAYAGGRFQAWQCGWYDGDIYTLDKNSAYVQAISLLPNLNTGKWSRRDPGTIRTAEDIARFGIYHIVFDDNNPEREIRRRKAGNPQRPYPLFHRDGNGRLSWPDRVDGWYWSPEAAIVAGSRNATFVEAIEYSDDGTYPFKWVKDSYDVRVHLQDIGNPAEKAYKWGLAALYGAFARRVGWDRKKKTAPSSHELAWAGYICSHCRAAIFDVAQIAWKRGGLISVDTDGVTSTVPFVESDVPEGFGKGLGQWKQDKYSGVLYWQNGIYWLRDNNGADWKDAKSRGVPKGAISVQDAWDALGEASFVPPYKPANLRTVKTRYIGYRQALNQQHGRWRVWVREPHDIAFGGTGKGAHFPVFCRKCKRDEGQMHVITHLLPKMFNTASQPHKLPWLEALPEDEEIGEIAKAFIVRDTDIFADTDLEDNL